MMEDDYISTEKYHDLLRENEILIALCRNAKAELAEFEEMNAGMREGFSERISHVINEVASVLQMLDELAELWGDEGKFRACRDRLRKLVTE